MGETKLFRSLSIIFPVNSESGRIAENATHLGSC